MTDLKCPLCHSPIDDDVLYGMSHTSKFHRYLFEVYSPGASKGWIYLTEHLIRVAKNEEPLSPLLTRHVITSTGDHLRHAINISRSRGNDPIRTLNEIPGQAPPSDITYCTRMKKRK